MASTSLPGSSLPSPELIQVLEAAFRRLFALPVMGDATRDTWRGLDLDSLSNEIRNLLIDKARVTLADGAVHSGLFILPGEISFAMAVLTWPKGLAAARQEAADHFFALAERYSAQEGIFGVAQLDFFVPSLAAAEIRLAWLPAPGASDGLPEVLQRTLLPWGGRPIFEEKPERAVGGTEMVNLAQAAWDLYQAMRRRLPLWPDEDGPARPGLTQVRGEFRAIVPRFNRAAQRFGLGHMMPVSDFDPTWLPHNLANAERFGSLKASLTADILRVWGKAARENFGACWDLLERSYPETPAENELRTLQEAPLVRERAESAAVPPPVIDVFLSYAWADKTRGVRDIYQSITSHAWTGRPRMAVWLDEEERPETEHLNDEIAGAMLRSKRILICLSMEMLTRGGYAMREVLLALTRMPHLCVLVRLDRTPVPPALAEITTVDWFRRDGPELLIRVLQSPLGALAGRLEAEGGRSLNGPLIDRLLPLVQRAEELRRTFDAAARQTQITLRGALYNAVSAVRAAYDAGDLTGMLHITGVSADLLSWSTLSGSAAKEDPTILSAGLRLRSALFRAHLHVGAQRDYALHYPAAYALLDEVVNADLDLFRPANSAGWDIESCRLAMQDCLDVFDLALEWFRGVTPKILVELSAAPAASAVTIEARINANITVLAERMLALRALEDTQGPRQKRPSWANAWSTMRTHIRNQFESGVHPATQAIYRALADSMGEATVQQIAVVLADGAIESAVAGPYREELLFDLGAFRLRCVVRCYLTLGSKHRDLESVRGTVMTDLLAAARGEGDLNVLFSVFLAPHANQEGWGYGLFMNCLPSPRDSRKGALPQILEAPFVVGEMLNEAELAGIRAGHGPAVYEELP